MKIQSNLVELLRGMEKGTKSRANPRANSGANSEWAELVGELTDFLNENRGTYGPWTPKFVGQKVAYIRRAGMGELRFFVSAVKEKGPWFFWYTVNPKKD